ncbi:MAG: hypothetical protein N3F07_04375 [Candidatus Micrarchaeota archaeon]|nr:hypothetical protein [Candidatus Micrarchaeota archaeon]
MTTPDFDEQTPPLPPDEQNKESRTPPSYGDEKPKKESAASGDFDQIVLSDITLPFNDAMLALFSIKSPDGKEQHVPLRKGESFSIQGKNLKVENVMGGAALSAKGVILSYDGKEHYLLLGQEMDIGGYQAKLLDLLNPSNRVEVFLELRGNKQKYRQGETFLIDGIKYKLEKVYLGFSLNAKMVEFSREDKSFISPVGSYSVFHVTQHLPGYAKFVDAVVSENAYKDDGKLVLGVYGNSEAMEDFYVLSRGDRLALDGKRIAVEDYQFGSWPNPDFAQVSIDGASKRLARMEKANVGSKQIKFEDVTMQSLDGIPRSEYAVFAYMKDGAPVKYALLKVGDAVALKDGSKLEILDIAAGQSFSALHVKAKLGGKPKVFRVGSQVQ